MNEKFKDIILNDEQITMCYKPDKLVFILQRYFIYYFFIGGLSLFFIPTSVIAVNHNAKPLIFFSISYGIIFLITFIFTTLLITKAYKNTFYAVTNKRLIIRTGAIGVDYKICDLNVVTNLTVYVSLIDKIFKRNTGTIFFASSAMPSANGRPSFGFTGIKAPYEVYKEIKAVIDGAN